MCGLWQSFFKINFLVINTIKNTFYEINKLQEIHKINTYTLGIKVRLYEGQPLKSNYYKKSKTEIIS